MTNKKPMTAAEIMAESPFLKVGKSAEKIQRGIDELNENGQTVTLEAIGLPSRTRLNAQERAIWNEVRKTMPEGFLLASDRIALEILCKLMAKLRNGVKMPVTEFDRLFKLLGKFGMTPTDRRRARMVEGAVIEPSEDPKNGFADF